MGKGWIIRGFRRGLYGKGRLKTSNLSFQTTFSYAFQIKPNFPASI
ncbi:hypothetical protein HMPREF1051_0116 [Neisseria sicca VK64]|uniref:Uncharacterized protein n=1 Tax=Neisseria sicca VK64 TaxID=1095748 RepID=I2NE25_NEISI|nr:hypothetical protein HMPREF1051_0116 [Neisseria sicca VK64]